MARIEIVVPRLGESVIEVTIIRWLKNEGDRVEAEEALAEIATDKVDSEIVSTASGKLAQKVSKEGDVVAVGKVFAIIEAEGEEPAAKAVAGTPAAASQPAKSAHQDDHGVETSGDDIPSGSRYYSPLVRSIAREEGLSFKELDGIPASGKDDRLTKQDIMQLSLIHI